jgi:hypothetical protein
LPSAVFRCLELRDSDGGGWRSIGTFSLNAGDYNVVGVSRWTSGVGYVIADAVRITRP